MTFGEFWRKYKVLSESSNTLSENLGVEQVKSAVQDLLEELDLDKTAVRLGNTQVSVYRFHLLRCLSYNWIYMSNNAYMESNTKKMKVANSIKIFLRLSYKKMLNSIACPYN